jgi:hypothetical protein
MSGRPWLEALKVTIRERGTHTEKLSEKILEALPSERCERCESPTDVPPPARGHADRREGTRFVGRGGAQIDSRWLGAEGARRAHHLGEPRDRLLLLSRGSTVSS